MDGWLELATGPLFALTFLVMVAGLARHVVLQLHLIAAKGGRLRNVHWRRVAADAAGWLFPVRHLLPGTLVLTLASILFHAGVILVPIFLADHVVMWESFFGIRLPRLGYWAADALTVLTIGALAVLMAHRLLIPRARALSRGADYVVLLMVMAPFLTGFLAAHPGLNPLPWRSMMLLHVLSAEALFVAVPFTKLAHMALFFFDRLSQVHWQFRRGAGDRVAAALFGKEARV
jgi:nitrate reductase gamma subunit